MINRNFLFLRNEVLRIEMFLNIEVPPELEVREVSLVELIHVLFIYIIISYHRASYQPTMAS